MKPLVLEYSIAREEWLTGLMAVLARYSANDPYRARMVVARLAGLVLLVLAWQAAGWSQWSLFAACLALPLGEAFIQRTIGRQAIGSTFDPGESDIWLEISEDGLHEKSRNRERRYLWSGVRGVVATGDVIAFDLAGTDILVIPNHAMDDEKRRELDVGLAESGHELGRHSTRDARAGITLPEVATVGKISVAVAIMSLVVAWASSGMFIAEGGQEDLVRNIMLALGAGLVAATLGWFATGAVLRALARRSEAAAAALGWIIFAAGTVVFLYAFYWR